MAALGGLNVASINFANGDPFFVGIDQSALMVDEKANPAQREALLKIFGGQAGGLWGLVAQMVKKNLGVTYVKFDFANDDSTRSVKAGAALDMRGGFVKAPPGMPLESARKRAQTYDVFYGPSMEKVVGISEKYRVNHAGHNWDINGRYSSSGRFTYEGP